MAILGAHMSIAGGYYKAIQSGAQDGCDCVQIFTKNNNQWRAKEITEDDVERFQAKLDEHNIQQTLSHASYLINLGSPKDELWKKSIDAFIVELRRADQLGVPYVVVHPGSFTTSTEAEGISRIAEGLNEVHQQTRGISSRCLLETTAGQGTNLGWKFEQLAEMLDQCQDPDLVGICADTCHMFAAGYNLCEVASYHDTWEEFDKLIGLEKMKAFHLNDSKKEFGSRKDRHEHIGQGHMGLAPFRLLVNDPRFSNTPMYLETAKGDAEGEYEGMSWDAANLSVLRGLIESTS
jgi:deoxyribonuclease-4|tara:strand:- start:890 stop:1765 length:876 start_codon:yes stop_codon:yes gene_type:complete